MVNQKKIIVRTYKNRKFGTVKVQTGNRLVTIKRKFIHLRTLLFNTYLFDFKGHPEP